MNRYHCATGLFRVHGNFDTPLISVADGPILKLYVEVTVIGGEFCLLYRVTGQDAIQEIEKWAEWAALASAANSAHFSISCMASCPVTLYNYSKVSVKVSVKIRGGLRQ